MKSLLTRFLVISVLMGTSLVFGSTAHADYSFNVSLDTSPLTAPNPLAANGPFSLNFQLIGDQSNTILLSNFAFGAGGAISGAPVTVGDATGNLSGSVTLTTVSTFFNSFTQGFTPGSLLTFDVSVTTNFIGPTPDAFTVAILDGSSFEIDTDGFADQLIQVDISGNVSDVSTYAGSGEYASVSAPTVRPSTSVPEPTALHLMGGALLMGRLLIRRKRRNESGAGAHLNKTVTIP